VREYKITPKGWTFFGALALLVVFVLYGVCRLVFVLAFPAPHDLGDGGVTSLPPNSLTPTPSFVLPSHSPAPNTEESPYDFPLEATDEPSPDSQLAENESSLSENKKTTPRSELPQATSAPGTSSPKAPSKQPASKPKATEKPKTADKYNDIPNPAPVDELPFWAKQKLPIVFHRNSTEISNPEKSKNDLSAFLPPRSSLAGYLVIVAGFSSEGENPGLALKRADVVAQLLCDEFSIDPAMIRTEPGSGGGANRRVDVGFRYVGGK